MRFLSFLSPRTVSVQKLLAVALMLVVFATGLYAAAVSKIFDTMRKTTTLAATIGEESKKSRALRTTARVIEQSANARKELDSHFLRESEAVIFIERVEALAMPLSVAVEFSLIQKMDDASKKKIFQISFKTIGSFENTMHFLSLVETLPYAIRFERAFLEKETGLEIPEKTIANPWRGVFVFAVESFVEDTEQSALIRQES